MEAFNDVYERDSRRSYKQREHAKSFATHEALLAKERSLAFRNLKQTTTNKI